MYLVRVHNSPWVDMLLNSEILSWFRATSSLLLLLKTVCLEWERVNTNIIVFRLTPPRLEPKNYRTRDEHAKYYTTEAVFKEYKVHVLILFECEFFLIFNVQLIRLQ
jgi:hypothetical protein